MSEIPSEFKRIVEADIDKIFEQRLSEISSFTDWFFTTAYGTSCEVIEASAKKNVHNDFRVASGDSFAYGETDVEAQGLIGNGTKRKPAALLIENKVDSDQMPKQGLRYQARAQHQIRKRKWSDSRCVLVGPASYLASQYPLGGYGTDGWDAMISFEDVASALEPISKEESSILIKATATANTHNKRIPAAMQFWNDYENYQREQHPDILLFLKSTKGSGAGGVWPSFYDNELRANKSAPHRKRIQVVHMDTNTYVSLYVKKVNFGDFRQTLAPIMDTDMRFAKPGGSWQSIQIPVPAVNVLEPFNDQKEAADQIFKAAELMFGFFIEHEVILMEIPILKPKKKST